MDFGQDSDHVEYLGGGRLESAKVLKGLGQDEKFGRIDHNKAKWYVQTWVDEMQAFVILGEKGYAMEGTVTV